MDKGTVSIQINNFISEGLNIDIDTNFSCESDLFDEIGLDSLGFVSLVSFLESTFNIKFETTDLRVDYFRTVNKIVDIVFKKIIAIDNGINDRKV